MKKLCFLLLFFAANANAQETVLLADSVLLEQAISGGGVVSSFEIKKEIKNPELSNLEKATLNPLNNGFSIILIGGKSVFYKSEGQITTIIAPKQ